jgi:glucose-6-phosphate-specific signal transduction histidine kinase
MTTIKWMCHMIRKIEWNEHTNKVINVTSVLLIILYVIFYSATGKSLGMIANLLAIVPILFVAICHGMRLGAINGVGISIFISVTRIIRQDPEFELVTALMSAIIAGIGGGTYGLLSDQRKELRKSEILLEEKVAKRTHELSRTVEAMENEVRERIIAEQKLRDLNKNLETRVRERTSALQKYVQLKAGNEIRIRDLEKIIQKLRTQIEELGIEPLADDPLNNPKDFE